MAEKKKLKRTVVGAVRKPQEDGKPVYLNIRGGDVGKKLAQAIAKADMKKGLNLRIESPKQQLESLEEAVAAGKISEEVAENVRDRISKIPSYVNFEIILLQEEA